MRVLIAGVFLLCSNVIFGSSQPLDDAGSVLRSSKVRWRRLAGAVSIAYMVLGLRR